MKIEHLQHFSFIPPGPTARAMLEPHRGRTMSLSGLEKIDGKCVWCNVGDISKRPKNTRWCTHDCIASGLAYGRPQTPVAKAYIFVELQDCVCRECGVDHSADAKIYVDKKFQQNSREHSKLNLGGPPDDVTLYSFGYTFLRGDKFHLDHRVPINRGGRGIGFENVQVICTDCHKKKTADEARGLR